MMAPRDLLFRKFIVLFNVFNDFQILLDLLGHVWTCSDVFRRIRIHFQGVLMIFEALERFRIL